VSRHIILHYAEENPGDVLAEEEAAAERQLRAWQAQQTERTKRPKGARRAARPAPLADVPF
jgi:hypothetical protein